jgi:hypothetical protein
MFKNRFECGKSPQSSQFSGQSRPRKRIPGRVAAPLHYTW